MCAKGFIVACVGVFNPDYIVLIGILLLKDILSLRWFRIVV
jgi:hypothetical protein